MKLVITLLSLSFLVACGSNPITKEEQAYKDAKMYVGWKYPDDYHLIFSSEPSIEKQNDSTFYIQSTVQIVDDNAKTSKHRFIIKVNYLPSKDDIEFSNYAIQ